MRVLVVDEWLPLPMDSGKRIRTFQLLAPLASKHEITYLCYADRDAELPGPTKAVMGISDFLRSSWYLLILGVVGGFFGFRYINNGE